MDIIAQLKKGVVLGLGAGALIYLGFSLFAEVDAVVGELRAFSLWLILPILGLSLLNYGIRFLRWQRYLARLGIDVPLIESLRVFMAGLAMTITPGKVGELLKSYLLFERCRIPMARSAPVVIAERVTDLLALVGLAGLGVGAYFAEGAVTVVAVGAALMAPILLIQSRRLSLGVIGVVEGIGPFARIGHKLRELYLSAAALLGPGPLLMGVGLGLLSWGMECLALYIILTEAGGDPGLNQASFVYAFSTVAGVVSPGGLGVTDGLLVVLATRLIPGVGRGAAVAAAFIIRLATLWFAVGLGALVLMGFPAKELHIPDEGEEGDPEGGGDVNAPGPRAPTPGDAPLGL